jgi:hypothetical protein
MNDVAINEVAYRMAASFATENIAVSLTILPIPLGTLHKGKR